MKKMIKIIPFIIAIFITISFTSAYYFSSSSKISVFKSQGYTIKLDASGGKYSNNSSVNVKNGKTTLPSPTRTGYTFQGYSTSSGGSVNYSTTINNIKDINNKTLYAKWSTVSYGISYNLNGGSISGQKTSYNCEQNFTLPIPTRTGYTFTGWTGSNGTSPQSSVTIPAGTTGNLNYTANWNINKYVVDINPIIQNVTYNSGLNGFTFSVWLNGTLVAQNVTDYYNSSITYGSTLRVYVNDRTGYNVTSFRDYTWTVTSSFNINPTWYDNIAPTITSFSVENLGYYNPSNPAQGWNVRVYINGYDNGTGVTLYQTWLTPYKNGTGGARKDGQERILKNVLYLNTSEGRTFCAYAIDAAGNEAEKCGTIKVK